jgi:hypothetical protein
MPLGSSANNSITDDDSSFTDDDIVEDLNRNIRPNGITFQVFDGKIINIVVDFDAMPMRAWFWVRLIIMSLPFYLFALNRRRSDSHYGNIRMRQIEFA